MLVQELGIVNRTDLTKEEKNLLNSKVNRDLLKNFNADDLNNREKVIKTLGDLDNRGRVIREILSRGPQGVKDALLVEYMEGVKDHERGRNSTNRRKHASQQKLITKSYEKPIVAVAVGNLV